MEDILVLSKQNNIVKANVFVIIYIEFNVKLVGSVGKT